jgi:hypothetical protein
LIEPAPSERGRDARQALGGRTARPPRVYEPDLIDETDQGRRAGLRRPGGKAKPAISCGRGSGGSAGGPRAGRTTRPAPADATLIGDVPPLTTDQIIALLAPIVIIQLGLMIVALHDLEQEDRRVRGGSKLVWALVIVFVNVVGPIIYLVGGREDA